VASRLLVFIAVVTGWRLLDFKTISDPGRNEWDGSFIPTKLTALTDISYIFFNPL
jgi:hypothetical protein